MDFFKNFGLATWDIFLQMSPYLLLGFLIAGILNSVINKQRITRFLGKPTIWSSVKAALIGVPLPLCSCGVIPTGVSFHKNGASKGATNSFLISTPQTGVDSVLMTYSMMNIYWAVFRPIAAFVAGILGGIVTDKLLPTPEQLTPTLTENSVSKAEKKGWFRAVFSYAFIDFLGDISRQLLLGILIAVLITLFMPQSLFTEQLQNPLVNMLIILVASIPLYVCATGSVPIAGSLLLAGVSPGAVLVFLMAGPATNAATITVLWRSIGKKATLIYLCSIIITAMAFGLIMDYGLNSTLFMTEIKAGSHVHGSNFEWLSVGSAIALIGLIIYVEIKKLIPKTPKSSPMNTLYAVEGMTCNHCKSSVEQNLMKLEGVLAVIANPGQNSVSIEGKAIPEEQIAQTINELGFIFKGKK